VLTQTAIPSAGTSARTAPLARVPAKVSATAPPGSPAGPLHRAGGGRRRAGETQPARSSGREKIKYYWPEHEPGYRRAERDGLAGWNELHGGHGFENFASRAFLEQALPRLHLSAPTTAADVLEYGCGTGPGACLLAARGFRVDAVDLSPSAIKLARRFTAERGLAIHFAVQDVCAAADRPPQKRYDVIVDSYCLQSVVTDEDRARLFAFVRARLKPAGFYLISTAMFDPARTYQADTYRDATAGVVYVPVPGDPARYDGAVQIDGTWWLPNRRHLTPAALRCELEAAGFRVVWQGGTLGGDLICVPNDGRGATGGPHAEPQIAASADVTGSMPVLTRRVLRHTFGTTLVRCHCDASSGESRPLARGSQTCTTTG
jgi:SAM-dependent methyltransferase